VNVLFIWFGKLEPIYGWRDTCIRRAKELYPEANFKCITNLKEFYGMELINADELCSQMELEGYYSDTDNFMALSDEMRFYWLANHKNTLYMDTDTYCVERLELGALPRKMGIEALWSGDDLKPFEDMLKLRTKGQFFIDLESDLKLDEMKGYFEHKPLWSKEFRKKDIAFLPTRDLREPSINRIEKLKKYHDRYRELKEAAAKCLDAVLIAADVLDFQPAEVNCILGYKFIKETHK